MLYIEVPPEETISALARLAKLHKITMLFHMWDVTTEHCPFLLALLASWSPVNIPRLLDLQFRLCPPRDSEDQVKYCNVSRMEFLDFIHAFARTVENTFQSGELSTFCTSYAIGIWADCSPSPIYLWC